VSFLDILHLALRNLRQAKLRFFLTTGVPLREIAGDVRIHRQHPAGVWSLALQSLYLLQAQLIALNARMDAR